MKGKIAALLLIVCMIELMPGIPEASAQNNVQITIDAKGVRKPVSPYIYGRNNSLSDNSASPVTAATWTRYRDAGITMFRDGGGNNSTKYNWRNKLSSHPDWYNNVYAHDWDYAAKSLQQNIPSVQAMWTLQLIGKAAGNKNNNFNDWGYNVSQWWTGCAQNLAGGGTVSPTGSEALKEGNPDLYLVSWPPDSVVRILNHWIGSGGTGLNKSKLLYWNMDNEPEIWSGTHDDVMPVQLSADAFMQRYFDTAKKARAIFPEIKLVGPVPANEWQWYNWNGNWISYGGKNYVWLEYFIKRIADEQNATGFRLLDVLDIHFYPTDITVSKDILQVHRVFYDKTYLFPLHNGVHRIGGWDTSINKEYIFERCKEWLVKYMGANHGVTFSVSETSIYNNAPVMVWAVWYASMLGEFARQGVEIFTPWDWKNEMWEVVHLFSYYNHENYIPSVSSQEEFVSAYPTISQNSDSIAVVLVNRSVDQTKDIEVDLTNYVLSSSNVPFKQLKNLSSSLTFNSHQQNALTTGNIQVSGNTLPISLPPLSITSLLIKGNPTGFAELPGNGIKTDLLALFPNPATTYTTVSWSQTVERSALLEIFNNTGQLFQTHSLNRYDIISGEYQLHTEGWQDGIYFIRLKSGTIFQTGKLSVRSGK
jgi:hypothetical protein